MKFLHKYGTRSIEIRRARREIYFRLSLVAAVILFLAGMIIIAKFRPRLNDASASSLPDTANVGDPMNNPELILRRAEVEALSKDFEKSLEEGPIDLEDLDILREAIRHQREVIRFRGSDIAPKADLEQLEKLLTKYDEEMGDFLFAQSESLASRAAGLQEAGDDEEALKLLLRARNLQEEVNEQYPRSSRRDPSRLYRLDKRVLAWQTRPMAEEADTLRREALAKAREGRHEAARNTMKEALELQQALNEAYRQSRYASMARLREFENSWTEIQVAEDRERILRLIDEAESALVTDQSGRALAQATEAEALNNRILSRFPSLAREARERSERILTLKDTAASIPAFEEIQSLRESVRDMLRSSDTEPFRKAVSDWQRALQRFVRTYPESRFLERLHQAEAAFLHRKRDVIPGILATVHAGLRPVPGHRNRHLFTTEVPQSLYALVNDENPSNSQNPSLPVDSVTWEEARLFVDRLSWILGHKAALPSRAILASARGEATVPNLERQTWNSGNTSRTTQPVGSSEPNPLGFHDLLGNVSEWIDSDTDNPRRVIAVGGSAREDLLRLAAVPEENRFPDERNRYIGFRFTVQLPD
ncbi:MAG: SUMF1/EgtB/PvdO family nonheme iron enzyme [Oceanipulchritudo sp.]